MISRTGAGYLYWCESHDEGETWSRSIPTNLPASGTPTSLRRVPSSDDIVLLWNQVDTRERAGGFHRHRLTAAVSSDGGATWKHRRNLESLDERTYLHPHEGGPRDDIDAIRDHSHDEKRRLLGLRASGYVMAEYTSMIFIGDQAVITYDVVLGPGCALKLRVLPLSWFYKNK